MRVLLTGANGFVGSHILDRLQAEGLPTVILLRPGSDPAFIARHLLQVEVRYGGLNDVAKLQTALAGVTHVIHCAGATKALHREGLFEANQHGTRTLVQAVNAAAAPVQRVVQVSSLAAGRSGTRHTPAREDEPSAPLSSYGESKRAGELELSTACRCEFTILRPAGVYGPRDREFLRLFKATASGITPLFGGGRQELSLVFAPDLAEVVVRALRQPESAGQTLNVASREVVTAGELAQAIARTIRRRTIRVRLPQFVLKLLCLSATAWARIAGRPTILAHGKDRELVAPGWVGDTTRLQRVMGAVCQTRLEDGLAGTLAWYRENRWM